jgi:hypothetical protein
VPPAYPLVRDDQRQYPAGWGGRVYVWDLDKTYLDTAFSSLPALLRIPLELGVDKRAIPGMAPLLRGLRRGPGPDYACAPLYFVSASPPQLRAVIERKMLMDGVEFDGLTFKDWLGVLRGLRPGRLREQVGYKVAALLTGRFARPASREVLFGDDTESDASAYHLYASLLEHVDDANWCEAAVRRAGVAEDDGRVISALLARLERPVGSVERAFIHLERETPPEQFAGLAPLVVPVDGAAQLGPVLLHLGLIDAAAARAALEEVAAVVDPAVLRLRLDQAVARGLVPSGLLEGLGYSPAG